MKTIRLTELSASERDLVRRAIRVRRQAYAPFSGYKCGSALLDVRGKIHTGCNVETVDLTLTTHAEMDAINSMVKSGVFQLKALAVAVQAGRGPTFPCGLCRQKIREFSVGDQARIIAVGVDGKDRIRQLGVTTIGALYPLSFTTSSLS